MGEVLLNPLIKNYDYFHQMTAPKILKSKTIGGNFIKSFIETIDNFHQMTAPKIFNQQKLLGHFYQIFA